MTKKLLDWFTLAVVVLIAGAMGAVVGYKAADNDLRSRLDRIIVRLTETDNEVEKTRELARHLAQDVWPPDGTSGRGSYLYYAPKSKRPLPRRIEEDLRHACRAILYEFRYADLPADFAWAGDAPDSLATVKSMVAKLFEDTAQGSLDTATELTAEKIRLHPDDSLNSVKDKNVVETVNQPVLVARTRRANEQMKLDAAKDPPPRKKLSGAYIAVARCTKDSVNGFVKKNELVFLVGWLGEDQRLTDGFSVLVVDPITNKIIGRMID